MRDAHLPLCLTMGDPAGIGPDLIIEAALAKAALPPFFVSGCLKTLQNRCALLDVKADLFLPFSEYAGAVSEHDKVGVVDTPTARKAIAGKPDEANGNAVITALNIGVDKVLEQKARAIVTAPIAKYVLYQNGFQYQGHTDYLAAYLEQKGHKCQPVMLIWSPDFSVIPLTIHIPLRDVFAALNVGDIVSQIRIVSHAYKMQFGIDKPSFAICGLNPHAGENGTIGDEEARFIQPAIEQLSHEGIFVDGPLPADTAFSARIRKHYDCIFGLYHDQVLTPLKALAFDEGVNVTLGLPILRTSPDHGTAFSLTGSGKADPSSFFAAIRLADRLCQQDNGQQDNG